MALAPSSTPAGSRSWPWTHKLAVAFAALGAVAMVASIWLGLAADDPKVAQAFHAGLVAAGATALGTLPVLLSQRLSVRMRDIMLGFGAGVMLAASAFSLVVPGLRAAESLGHDSWGSAGIVGLGILLGAFALVAIDRWVPHEHFIKGFEGSRERARAIRRSWLFVFAISLHNLPEGLAIGVAYAGTDALRAAALATGIAIQDLPEGLVIATALRSAGYGRGFSVMLGAASGLVEPMGAVAGAAVIGLSAGLLPWGLAFAAGAMLFVISHEMIPESHRAGHERWATGGLMVGFVLMMMLDTALG
jgi:zinc transporter, ZIP family